MGGSWDSSLRGEAVASTRFRLQPPALPPHLRPRASVCVDQCRIHGLSLRGGWARRTAPGRRRAGVLRSRRAASAHRGLHVDGGRIRRLCPVVVAAGRQPRSHTVWRVWATSPVMVAPSWSLRAGGTVNSTSTTNRSPEAASPCTAGTAPEHWNSRPEPIGWGPGPWYGSQLDLAIHGIALAPMGDLDGDGWPDLAVGSTPTVTRHAARRPARRGLSLEHLQLERHRAHPRRPGHLRRRSRGRCCRRLPRPHGRQRRRRGARSAHRRPGLDRSCIRGQRCNPRRVRAGRCNGHPGLRLVLRPHANGGYYSGYPTVIESPGDVDGDGFHDIYVQKNLIGWTPLPNDDSGGYLILGPFEGLSCLPPHVQ